MKKYSKEHEWVEFADGVATVGITEYAANELGDITFIELPETEEDFAVNDVLCVVESVKAASDVFCPVNGKVTEVNEDLEDAPEKINSGAENEGWICKMSGVSEDDINTLMSESEYKEFVS